MPAFVPVVYSGGAPVLASGGSQRVACAHLAEWLAVYDALQVARGRGHVTYFQTMGGADASAGTHTCGSAWDMAFTGNAPILDAREMGAAVWPRLHSLGWVGGEHVHGLISCGDNSCNAYQYAAYLLGYNGLGQNGYGAGDPLPQPTTRRTWREGIVWAKAEIARLTAPTPQEEPDMVRLIKHVTHQGGDRTKPVTGQALYVWTPFSGLTPQGGDQAANERLFGQSAEVFEDGEIDGVRATVDAIVARNIAAVKSAPVTVPAPVVNIDYAAIAAAVVDLEAKRLEN